MMPTERGAIQERSATSATFIIAAGIGILWQVYIVAAAFRFAATLRPALANLGVQAPMLTRAFLATYRWWYVAPLLCAVLLFGVVRRDRPGDFRGPLTLVLCLATGLLLQAWLTEAWFRPLAAMFEAVR
ncbi:MAG TPA: hypothetical protein VF178_09345 [Gemmatimonadaceae bacterium]